MAPQKLSGQQLIDHASQQKPIKIGGLPIAVIGLSVTLCVISGLCMVLRIFVRAWVLRKERSWGWDDTLALLSFVSIFRRVFSLGYCFALTTIILAADLLTRMCVRHHCSTVWPGDA